MQLGIQREESTQRKSPVCTIWFFFSSRRIFAEVDFNHLYQHPTQEVQAFLTILSNNVTTSPHQANQ